MKNYRRAFLKAAWSLLLTGCEPKRISEAAATQERKNNGLMWIATSPTGVAVALVPTIHVIPKTVNIPTKIIDQVNRSAKVLVEADLAEKTDLADALKECVYAPGDNVTRHITAETRELLAVKTKKFNIAEGKIEKFKPWALWFYFLYLAGKKSKLGAVNSVDGLIMSEARRVGVPVIRIESFVEQFKILDSLNDAEQDLLLRESLRADLTPDNYGATIEAIAKKWVDGDFIITEESGGANNSLSDIVKGVNDVIIDRRNIRFAEKIKTEVNEFNAKSFLVAVGINHFGGPKGLLSLLRKNGFSIASV